MPDNLPVLDSDVLNQLRSDVGADAMPVLMDALRRELSASFATIVSALESGDFALLETTAHALKSSSASFGAARVSAVCLKMELAAKACEDAEVIKQLVPQLEAATAEVSAIFGFNPR